ncbi:MAG: hypothetical protein LPK85_13260, partial [Gammaproteobacteria bacterium]|nr:hypothetical protein [Gammaproteobacteria bacterium]
MGAARGISHALHADERCAQDVSAFLITHNLGSVGRHTEQLLRQLGRDESMLIGYRCGLEAAESWMARKYVPDALSLYALMSEEAFV